MYHDIEKQNQHYRDLYVKSPKRQKDIRESKARRRLRTRNIIFGYKSYFGCCDCGYNVNPLALDFDHRDSNKKVRCVSEMIANSHPILGIFEEIAKCDVRCANCHRIRHYQK